MEKSTAGEKTLHLLFSPSLWSVCIKPTVQQISLSNLLIWFGLIALFRNTDAVWRLSADRSSDQNEKLTDPGDLGCNSRALLII